MQVAATRKGDIGIVFSIRLNAIFYKLFVNILKAWLHGFDGQFENSYDSVCV